MNLSPAAIVESSVFSSRSWVSAGSFAGNSLPEVQVSVSVHQKRLHLAIRLLRASYVSPYFSAIAAA